MLECAGKGGFLEASCSPQCMGSDICFMLHVSLSGLHVNVILFLNKFADRKALKTTLIVYFYLEVKPLISVYDNLLDTTSCTALSF